jgi:hypothetical protein
MSNTGRHRAPRARWTRRARLATGAASVVLTAALAAYATNWVVGLDAGSNGQAQSATITTLTITATATPSPSNTLYPGGSGDVVVTVSNPNKFPVTITAVNLPTNTTYAAGYSDSGLVTAVAGCNASTNASYVTWTGSTSTSGSSHTLTTPLVVAASGQANNPLTVTFTNGAGMGTSAPLACAGSYFSMPSFTGIAASGGGPGSPTTSPATDTWS